MQLGGPEFNLSLIDVKEKFCLRIVEFLEETERGINIKDLITVELMVDGLNLLRKAEGNCEIDLLYATRKQLLRNAVI